MLALFIFQEEKFVMLKAFQQYFINRDGWCLQKMLFDA